MINIDPVALGDVAFTRASPKWVYDRSGTLVQVPANALAVTYDPSDPGKAPYASVEPAATNCVRNNTMRGTVPGVPGSLPRNWSYSGPVVFGVAQEIVGVGQENGIDYIDINWSGTATASNNFVVAFESDGAVAAAHGQTWVNSIFAKIVSGAAPKDLLLTLHEFDSAGAFVRSNDAVVTGSINGTLSRISHVATLAGGARTAYVRPLLFFTFSAGQVINLTLRIGLPQLERDRVSSPIKTASTFVRRPGPGTYWDNNGALQAAASDVERTTYNPANLGAAPYKLWEAAATNYIRNNTMQGAQTAAASGPWGMLPTNWQVDLSTAQRCEIVDVQVGGVGSGVDFIDVRFYSAANDRAYVAIYPEPTNGTGVMGAAPGQVWAGSAFFKSVVGALPPNSVLYIRSLNASGAEVGSWGTFFTPSDAAVPLRQARQQITTPALPVNSDRLTMFYLASGLAIGAPFDFTLRIALPQLERNSVSSPIKTSSAAVGRAADEITNPTVTRAADVVGAGAGLVYSNVPITEPNYDSTATYAKDATVHDPASHNTFQSLIAANKGRALTDTGAWTPRGATNQRAMLDQYNNTQTTAADEILIVVSPEAISQGLYVGNTYADEVRVSVVDQIEGVVYRETSVLLESNSESSFFNWAFKPIKRRDYFFTLSMLPYANALITVSLLKVGGRPACGMCAIGPVDEYGPSLYGLSTEGKDYSSTTFNLDGTSNTVVRPYAKKLTCDVRLDNRQIDYVQARLFERRQKPVVWIGGPFGITAVFGRYSSFKIVIEYVNYSFMSLTIEGAV